MAQSPLATVNAPDPNAGILANAMNATQQISGNSTTGQVQNATAATADNPLGTTQASTYNPSTATASNAGLSQVTVDPNQTVAGQLATDMSVNSPLMQQAKAQSLDSMNGRGLINSSMAIGAGQGALYDKALQIATPDASTYANAATNNAQMANTNAQFNAGNQTQVSEANTNSLNTAGAFNAGQTQQASSQNATFQNALQSQNLQNEQQANITNAGAFNTALQSDAASQMQAKLANQQTTNQVVTQNLDSAFKASVANTSGQTQLQLQDLQSQTSQTLANIQATYQTTMQTSSSASQLYQQSVKNITAIAQDPTLDATSKQAAIAQQTQMLNDGMNLFGQLNNLGIGQILSF